MSSLLVLLVLQSPFPDVPANHWAAGAIQTLKTAGVVNGYPAQAEDGRFGKTDAQILAMGRKAWIAFAAEGKMGGSTMGYVTADSVYADALGARNARFLAKRPATERQRVQRLQKALQAYANDFIGIGSGITGGGTMWNMISASTSADVEELVAAVVQPATAKGATATNAQVIVALSQAAKLIDKSRKEIDANKASSNVSYKDAIASLADARKLYVRTINPILQVLPSKPAGLVREFCRNQASLKNAQMAD